MHGEYPISIGAPDHGDRNTPVCTGNTHRTQGEEPCRQKHPRMHGEYLCSFTTTRVALETPPYARGIRCFDDKLRQPIRNTPVCTGNTGEQEIQWEGIRKHPRMHGEYYVKARPLAVFKETPPYARGILLSHKEHYTLPRNTPVCTGNTLVLSVLLNRHKKHPRMHGEY